jgi:SAM-dependent methyltransferase
MPERSGSNPPSPFVMRWLSPAVAGAPVRTALDLACGSGRHALAMARAGYAVTALDIRFDALQALRASAEAEHLSIRTACVDLTRLPLPHDRYDLIVVTRYLDRTFFPALRAALRPGGVLVYETFTEHQLHYGEGPRSSAHLLRPGELRTLVRGMDVLFDEEVTGPPAVARLAARKRYASVPNADRRDA